MLLRLSNTFYIQLTTVPQTVQTCSFPPTISVWVVQLAYAMLAPSASKTPANNFLNFIFFLRIKAIWVSYPVDIYPSSIQYLGYGKTIPILCWKPCTAQFWEKNKVNSREKRSFPGSCCFSLWTRPLLLWRD